MNGKIGKLFGVLISLALVLALSGVGVAYDSDPASAGLLKWSRINIPDKDNWQLAPMTDVGPIALTPDGDTLFAAVYNESTTRWHVNRSNDGGYSWRSTGFTPAFYNTWAGGDTIVDVEVSPGWETQDENWVFVATDNWIFNSYDGGNTFSRLGAPPDTPITCMDIGLDDDNDWELAIGTYGGTPDVYLLVYGDWIPQDAYIGLDPAEGVNNGLYGVLDVAFSPTYADDPMIFALVNGERLLDFPMTMLRGENDLARTLADEGNWGAVSDAPFTWGSSQVPIFVDPTVGRGVIAFGDDFDSGAGSANFQVLVGLTAYSDLGNANFDDISRYNSDNIQTNPNIRERGNVFRVSPVYGFIGTVVPETLEIRPSEGSVDSRGTNVWSLAVSGSGSSGTFLAGLHELDPLGALTSWTSTVHYSNNGGNTWMQSYKPPSGALGIVPPAPFQATPHVIVAPDFDNSGLAYSSTAGFFSGFWASTTFGTTFNGRGLLDFDIDTQWGANGAGYRLGERGWISDIKVSPSYASDDTIFMITQGETNFPGSPVLDWPASYLWQTKDGGDTWEVILGMNALFPLPGIFMEKIELPANYPSDNSLLVTGRWVGALTPDPCVSILMSQSGGDTFTTPLATDEFVVTAWHVVDSDVVIAAGWDRDDYLITPPGGDQMNSLWWTDDAGLHWYETMQGPPVADMVTDLAVSGDTVLIGTSGGEVFICYDYEDDFSFFKVGEGPGMDGDWVSVDFDMEYYSNDIIYCALNSSGSGGAGEIYNFDLSSSSWEQISDYDSLTAGYDPMNVVDLDCADDGTLYALDAIYPNPARPPIYDGHTVVWRSADPIDTPIDPPFTPLFEVMENGLRGANISAFIDHVFKDMNVVGGTNYIIAAGTFENPNGFSEWTLWEWHDTLTDTRSGGPVDLLFPPDESTGIGTLLVDDPGTVSIVLQWEEAEGAEWYEWEVATDPQFTNKVAYHAFFRESGGTAVEQITDGELLQGYLPIGRTFYWHVKVIVPYQSEWSETWSFDTMPGSGAPRPSLISPSDGITGVGRKPVLQWTSVIDATNYELILGKCSDWLTNPVESKLGSNALGPDTAYQVTTPLEWGANYCWKVKAIKGDTESAWSDAGSFTVEVQVIPEPEEGTPFWVWLVIGIAAILLIAVIALIVLTKKS